jgi:hypothetical protein
MIGMVFVTAVFALRQPDIFEYLPGHQPLADDEQVSQQKYQKHSITEEDMRQYATMLEIYMSTHRPFLDEELTLKDLAVRMKIPAHHLSITLNSCLNRNFYAYITAGGLKNSNDCFVIHLTRKSRYLTRHTVPVCVKVNFQQGVQGNLGRDTP